jgi:hypothetical protein
MQLGQENTPGNIPRETAEELFQELGSLGLQSGEVIRHKGSLSLAQLLYAYRDAQNHVIKKGNPLGRTPEHNIELAFLFPNLREETIKVGKI